MNKRRLRIISLLFINFAILLTMYNLFQTRRANIYSQNLLSVVKNVQKEKKSLIYEEENLAIPSIVVDGIEIIGSIEIPKLNVNLPVTKNWDYNLMLKYSNMYIGETYNEPLIIMAHNYISHFGRIYKLDKNDIIIFTDVVGRVSKYRVKVKEVIDGKDVDSMVNTDHDLTLFTCTFDSLSRVTIRADKNDF